MAETLTQLPSIVDIAFVAGDSFAMRVRVLEPLPVTLDQYQFCAEIAQLPTRAVVAQFQVAPDPSNPTTAVILSLTPAETAVLPGMGDGTTFEGIWDLEVTFPAGDVRTVAKGAVYCEIDVSNCVTPVPPAATGATAGMPGTWEPAGSTPAFSVEMLQATAVTATPSTHWLVGEYMRTSDAGEAYWNGTAWIGGRAP